jgi:DNA-binding transcriptional ArsR family regulator
MSRAYAATDVFTAIAEPRRRQIIELLARRRGLAVGAIVLALGLRQPSVSKHLGVLRAAGLVSVNKQGQQRVYELNVDPLRPVYDWVKAFEQHWDHQLDRIKSRAEQRAMASLNATTEPGGTTRPGATTSESSATTGRTKRKKGTS